MYTSKLLYKKKYVDPVSQLSHFTMPGHIFMSVYTERFLPFYQLYQLIAYFT